MNGDDLLEGAGDAKTVEVLESGGRVCVLVNGHLYMSWESGDEESRRMAIVQLYECERGTREQLADAFSVHVNSVQKVVVKYLVSKNDPAVIRVRNAVETSWLKWASSI